MTDIPQDIQNLIDRRNDLRQQKKFEEADVVRQQIEQAGYEVIDTPDSSQVRKIVAESIQPKNHYIVIFGSGEITSIGRSIHEYIFKHIDKEHLKVVIVSTPAGFQPNVKVVYDEVKDFFVEHLQNFHPLVEVVYANNREEANNSEIIKPLEDADYIFIGAGSPTYAIKALKDTKLFQLMIDRTKQGASLVLASAAAIAFSKHAVPVYEIYKVGTELYWETGLDVYSHFYKPLTVIPHFDNNEGGVKTDTSHSYIGKERFEKMTKLLPLGENVIGIDEQTAFIIDLKTKETTHLGKGSIHQL